MPRKVVILLGLAPLAALVGGMILALAPVYRDDQSLYEDAGGVSLLFVAGMVLLMASPLRASPAHQAALATAIGIGTVIFSFISVIGLWFLPGAALLLLASVLAPGAGSR